MRREKKNQSISLKELIGKMKRHSTLSIVVTAGLSAILCGTIIYLLLPVPKASAGELPEETEEISSDMTEEIRSFQDEVNAINEKIDNGQKSINEIIKLNNSQLEKMDHTKEEIDTIRKRGETLVALGDKFTDLGGRMDRLDESSRILQQYITENNSANTKSSESISGEIKKINDQYGAVTQQLSDITKAYNQVKSDLGAAIAELSEKSSSEHDEIIEALNTINSDILTDSSMSFEKLSKELTAFSESSLVYLEALQADINDQIGHVDSNITSMNENINNQSEKYLEQSESSSENLKQLINNMNENTNNQSEKYLEQSESSSENLKQLINNMNENTNNQSEKYLEQSESSSENLKQLITNIANDNSKSLKEINDNTINRFTQIKEEYGSGNDSLIQMVNNLRTDMSSGFEKVFQSVSDGKRLVASALLTKNVNIKDDATFKEIHDAILGIPQEIIIGTDRLPGEISYDYHHHKDAQGKDTSDVQKGVGEKGGCYTVPVYHVHTGDIRNGSGCYTTPVYHNHSDSCYSTFSYRATTDNIVNSYGEENGEQVFEYHCNDCGGTFRGVNGWHTHIDKVLICGRDSGSVERYSPGCGMDNTTVVGYGIGCSLTEGQITGAHITYIQEKCNFESSEPVMQQSTDIATIGSRSLLSEEEQIKLIEDKKKEAEDRENLKSDISSETSESSRTVDSQFGDSSEKSDSSETAESQAGASSKSNASQSGISSESSDLSKSNTSQSGISLESQNSSKTTESQAGNSAELSEETADKQSDNSAEAALSASITK